MPSICMQVAPLRQIAQSLAGLAVGQAGATAAQGPLHQLMLLLLLPVQERFGNSTLFCTSGIPHC